MTLSVTPDREKDLKGVACPMNMVYTKVELAKMEPGQVLAVILDNGPPINNVPASVEKEGHEILGREQQADGTWLLQVKKR